MIFGPNYVLKVFKIVLKEVKMAVAEPKTCIGGNRLMGINHYYALHRLSVEIHVPSRGCILRKKSVCLHKFGMIFFPYTCLVHHIKISGYVFELFFQFLLVSKNIARLFAVAVQYVICSLADTNDVLTCNGKIKSLLRSHCVL